MSLNTEDMKENLEKIAAVMGYKILGWKSNFADIGREGFSMMWNPYYNTQHAMELCLALSIYLLPSSEDNQIGASFTVNLPDGSKEVMSLWADYYPNNGRMQTMRDVICESVVLMYEKSNEQ